MDPDELARAQQLVALYREIPLTDVQALDEAGFTEIHDAVCQEIATDIAERRLRRFMGEKPEEKP